jgi:glycerol-3-phosphate dehydrogenase
MESFDVAIVGAGVVGSALARELARYKLRVAVFDPGTDVCSGVSKANSGVVHSGIYSKPGSLKARFCVEGNRRFDALSKELNVPLERIGKFVVSLDEEGLGELEKLWAVGQANKVPGMKMVDGAEVAKKEAGIKCHKALWVPSAGITLPYKLTIALAENASENGVRFFLESKVVGLSSGKKGFQVLTKDGKKALSTVVINCAGLHCDDIVAMVEEPDFKVYPCRGEYLLIDKEYSHLVRTLVYPVPPKDRAVVGVHVTPTIGGPLLIGPSSEPIDDCDDTATTAEVMKMLLDEAQALVPGIPRKAVINGYSGVRCRTQPIEKGWIDYRIEESSKNPGMFNLLGIESPGLTGATAIAKYVVDLADEVLDLKVNPDFEPVRKKRPHFSEMTNAQRARHIAKDSAWGRVICRCEQVTEAEVVEALENPLGAKTLASVKYRTRAGMGRCQGGFCTQHVVRILEKRFGVETEDIRLKDPGSNMFSGPTRNKGGPRHA